MNWKTCFTAVIVLLLAGGIFAGSLLTISPGVRSGPPARPSEATPQTQAGSASQEDAPLAATPGGDSEQDIVVALKLRNPDELDQLLRRQSDPASSDFQKFLTVAEFEERFSPTQADVDKLVAQLRQAGSTVVAVSPNRSFIHIRRKLSRQPAIVPGKPHTAASLLPLPGGQKHGVASTVDTLIEAVVVADRTMVYRSILLPGGPSSAAPERREPPGLSPQDVATLYDFPSTNNRTAPQTRTYSGRGQRIAVVSAWGFSEADVQRYWSEHRIARTGTVTVKPLGPSPVAKNHIETTMNLQQVGAQAPGADIVMYLAPSALSLWFDMALDAAVKENVDIVSISWLSCERTFTPELFSIRHNILKQATAQGIAVFVASGDQGAYCAQEASSAGVQPKAVLDIGDSSDPFVTSVGGTTLVPEAGGKFSETAWSGSGGGESTYNSRPAWQKGTNLPQGDKRLVSDVAFVADPDARSAYDVLYEGQWHTVGGTSFGAPNWAALWALAQEAAGKRLGPANPLLYSLAQSPEYPAVFNDITAGNNGYRIGPGFSAGPGWDHPTGWGTPKAAALIQALASGSKSGDSR